MRVEKPEPYYIFSKRPQPKPTPVPPPLPMLDDSIQINWELVLGIGLMVGSLLGLGWLLR